MLNHVSNNPCPDSQPHLSLVQANERKEREKDSNEIISSVSNGGELYNSKLLQPIILAIDDVQVGATNSEADPKRKADVLSLAESIAAVGLLHPILINESRSLIAGRNRIEACRLLGHTSIAANIFEGTPEEGELAHIDEDIEHKLISTLERCDLLARRKQLVESLGETKRESSVTFTRATAQILNRSQRSVQQDIEIANKIPQEVKDAIRSSPLANQKNELIKLKRLSAQEQHALIPHIGPDTKKITQARTAQRRQEHQIAANNCVSESIEVWLGDFRKQTNRIQAESVNLILTDLPYEREYLPLWSDLSKIGERVLKPSGFLISYSGQMYLPEVMKRLGEHLDFFWLAGLQHVANKVRPYPQRNVLNVMKPILIYNKPPMPNPPPEGHPECFHDLISSEGADKEWHEWGQSIEPFEYLIQKFSKPGDLVLEPCSGGGTTAVACLRHNRRCIAIEREQDAFNTTLYRVNREHDDRRNLARAA